jgi:tRNA pseudouridine55 synthase
VTAAGFLVIDKPAGWTSHDVVARVRNIVGGKVGHAGTLDPMATGLLIVGLGKATRLLRFVQGREKEYEARAVFGVATDSLDADGAVLDRAPMPVSEEDVAAAMKHFVGTILQVPPMVSARKVDGRRLYEIARRGDEVERDARPVTIRELELTDFVPSDYPEIGFRVTCSSGTYVRTLADDIAAALGGRAHLIELRRTRNGAVSIEQAVTIELIEAADDLTALVLPPRALLDEMPVLTADDDLEAAVRNGVVMPASIWPTRAVKGLFQVVDGQGRLLAVYGSDGRKLRPEVVVA